MPEKVMMATNPDGLQRGLPGDGQSKAVRQIVAWTFMSREASSQCNCSGGEQQ